MTPTLAEAISKIEEEAAQLRKRSEHGGSRMVQAGADADVVDHIAKGGSVRRGSGEPVEHAGTYGTKDARTVEPGAGRGGGRGLAKALLDVARHRTEHMTPLSESKALSESTDSAGGFLLTPEIAQSVMMLIRNRVAVARMPITTVHPRSKQFVLPGLAGGASASWLAENAAIPAAAETFNIAASMVPRPLGSLVAISNRLLADATSDNPNSAGNVEDVIRSDVADLMAVTFDAGLLTGSGTIAPRGILNVTGTTALPAGTIATNGSQVSYALLVAIVGALQQANMPFSSPGWIFSGRTLQSLQTLTTSIGSPLLASSGLLTVDSSGTTGRLMGYPWCTSNAVPNNTSFGTANNASTIIFASDWSELFLGDWQSVAIDSSQEASYSPDGGTTWISSYQSQQTVFRATLWADMAIRRPAAFVLTPGILP